MLIKNFINYFINYLSKLEDFGKALQELLIDIGYADFHIFKKEYIIEGILVNETPIHIGTGGQIEPLSPVDNAVIRMRKGRQRIPIIPGSSFKGVLRTYAEIYGIAKQLLPLKIPSTIIEYLVNKGVNESELIDLKCTGDSLANLERLYRRNGVYLKEIIESNNISQNDKEELLKCYINPVIGVFGAPWLASHIIFYDAIPEDPEKVTTRIIRRVAIDRITGSQKPGLLYDIEVVDPAKWRFSIKIINIDLTSNDSRLQVIKNIFATLTNGIMMGGRTSIGQGMIRLEKESLRCREVVVDKQGTKLIDCDPNILSR